MFRFLHLGDLHLDSPFAGFTAEEGAARRARQYEALENLLHAGRKLIVHNFIPSLNVLVCQNFSRHILYVNYTIKIKQFQVFFCLFCVFF